ncbi:hypothetical protein HELRODRAFT_188959 [Helobdella robusta]|uniref:peptidylprolyl isomerase n=1 Tax=Helobdella robusta TaxID=6412 RepID=T1FQI2_HELRO|nr:hypothetical protein HELRODRAFT_188959 [Helobdella robusta]ESN98938.1 hypothetical protein HELRODRAFT_188959 [Helobdella robusta]
MDQEIAIETIEDINTKQETSESNLLSNGFGSDEDLKVVNNGFEKEEVKQSQIKELHSETLSAPLSPDDIKEPEEPNHIEHCPQVNPCNALDSEDIKCSANNEGDELKSAENDGWTLILGHDQIKKRVIMKGDEKACRPRNGQQIQLKCSGKLDDGTVVDVHEKLTLALGEDEHINAFDLCVPLMHPGEVCELVTEARFAYGEKGRKPDIPGNARITYELELLDVQDQQPYSSMPLLTRTNIGESKRERGNELYGRGEFTRSIDAYHRAIKALGDDDEHNNNEDDTTLLQSWLDSRVKCFNNMAAAQMKIDAWEAAARSCDQVLKVQPENVKALFRKGKCLMNQRDTTGAVLCLKKALKLDPNSKVVLQELQKLEKKKQQENEIEKNLYKKMLGTKTEETSNKKLQTSSNKWFWYGFGAVSMAGLSALLMAYHRWS